MQTKDWKYFEYQEIFDIKKGKRLTKADMFEGNIPFIGATETNNGVTGYIGNNEFLHSGNTITVCYNGSIGNAFYQEKEFWASDDVNVLYPRFFLNKYIALFLISLIEKEKYRFSYGNKWDSSVMKVSKIKLPITSSGIPDWDWIENYMRYEVIKKLPQTVQDLFSDSYIPKSVIQKKLSLDTEKWKWFRYEQLFQIDIGKSVDLNKLEQQKNGVNYVARTEENNGITAKVLYDGNFEVYKGNCLTVPMVGNELKSSYQVDDFCVSQNIAIFRPIKFVFNKYIAIFLNTLIRKDIFRFAYGRTLSLDRLKMLTIKLPVTPSGDPDWQFMEEYIKSLPYSAFL